MVFHGLSDSTQKIDVEASKDYISLFLHVHPGAGSEALVSAEIRILGADGTAARERSWYDSRTRPDLLKPGSSWGYSEFIERKVVLDDRATHLPNKNLTVHCEMSYAVDGQRVQNPSFPLPPKTPNRVASIVFRQLYESKVLYDVV